MTSAVIIDLGLSDQSNKKAALFKKRLDCEVYQSCFFRWVEKDRQSFKITEPQLETPEQMYKKRANRQNDELPVPHSN